jgi:hypothetical protein
MTQTVNQTAAKLDAAIEANLKQLGFTGEYPCH